MKPYHVIAFICATISIVSVVVASPASARQVQLEQQINPIDCIYTTAQTGVTVTTSTNCANQPVPTVTSVTVNGGRPVVRGYYQANRTAALQVWLYGQWYTMGVDGRLTVDGDTWELDLSNMTQSLPPGTYTIAVWVETSEGLAIRNSSAAAFTITYAEESQDVPVNVSEVPDMPTVISSHSERRPRSIFMLPSSLSVSPLVHYPVGDSRQSVVWTDYGSFGEHQFNPAIAKLYFWSIIVALGLFTVLIATRYRRRSR